MGDEDFDGFWSSYPRKEAKKDAMKAWASMNAEQRFAARESLPLHVRYWNAAGRSKQYIPLPATWLRGERWEDELEIAQAPSPLGEWWKSTAGIQMKAIQAGITPRAGEDWNSLKARILAKERAA